ncbi:hypothetical protein [Myroides odoratus]|uniref:Uncharacterized protein n=1 Tax=Myroides odoratus TaxID=256 RepID=A0A9Q7E767_MYROD|nr:hypothetical protein [Myroides odoratus]QQT99115.1 hypothetical protein I6I88_12945 [Myroides odoratus]WQD58692.1 hypothetical protein U0010_06020 [Myroides odoratus]
MSIITFPRYKFFVNLISKATEHCAPLGPFTALIVISSKTVEPVVLDIRNGPP